MRKKETAGPLQQVRDALNSALPDEVEDLKILHLPNGVMHIEVTIREHHEEENKWIRFADEMHQESPLQGKSDELNARVREFRDGFSFDRGE